jgi:hypothetical protein
VAGRWAALLVGREARVMLRSTSAGMHTLGRAVAVGGAARAQAPVLARGLKTYEQFGESAPGDSSVADLSNSNDSRLVDATLSMGTVVPPVLSTESR